MSGKRIVEVVDPCEHDEPHDFCVRPRRILTEGQYVLIEKEDGEWPRVGGATLVSGGFGDMTTPSGFVRCSHCRGSGLESEHDGWSCDGDCCPSCSGSGLLPTEKLREDATVAARSNWVRSFDEMADAVLAKVAEHLGDRE